MKIQTVVTKEIENYLWGKKIAKREKEVDK